MNYSGVLFGALVAMLWCTQPSFAQPGAGENTGTAMATNPSTGGVDVLGAGALNMQFDMMAMLLQQRTFLLTAAALADPKFQQRLVEEQKKAAARLEAYEKRGASLIQRGAATTLFMPVADSTREERIASAFGADALSRGLVPNNLRVYDNLARQRGLRPFDMADVLAASVAICYQVARNLPDWDISPKALEDLRAAARTDVLSDARYQGMPDADKHTLHDFLIVWVVALVADYQQARQMKFLETPMTQVRQRAAEAVRALMNVPVDRLQFTDRGFAIK